MMENTIIEMLAVEFFTSKDSRGIVMSVPVRCGLRQADTLRVSGETMVAMNGRVVLSLDLPKLNLASRDLLIGLAAKGKVLPVGEFMGRGLVDSYFLNVVVVE